MFCIKVDCFLPGAFQSMKKGAVFVDAGYAFDEGRFEVNVGAGFGVHYLTPDGAIKIELANSISEDDPSWRLHINIGAES